ncbi:MAG: hypothetical protein ACFFAO_12935 [Candidatus Hermodarchaeota archaeon]
MNNNQKITKKAYSNEVVGKFFILNKTQQRWIEGWISIDRNFKQFLKNVKDEIESEWDFEKINIENLLLYYIDPNTNKLIQIKDDKNLQFIKRYEKIFIVILDKVIKFNKIKDIEPLYNWYRKTLLNYES